MFGTTKGYKGFYYDDFGYEGICEPSDCRHIVNDVCSYAGIYDKGRGYCWSSTKCKFRPIFPSRSNMTRGDNTWYGDGFYRRSPTSKFSSG